MQRIRNAATGDRYAGRGYRGEITAIALVGLCRRITAHPVSGISDLQETADAVLLNSFP